jgi:Ca2+-binding RTX toxin-like protein
MTGAGANTTRTTFVDNVSLIVPAFGGSYTYTVNLDAALADNDGSETLKPILVSVQDGDGVGSTQSLPAGAVLLYSNGDPVPVNVAGSSWLVDPERLSGLQLKVDKPVSASLFTLRAEATSEEGSNLDTESSVYSVVLSMPPNGSSTPNAIPEIDSASVTLSNVESMTTLGASLGDDTNTFSWVSVADSLPALYANGELISYTFDPDPAPAGNQSGTITGSTSQGDVFQLTITYNTDTGEYEASYVQYASLQGAQIEATGESMSTGGGNGNDLLLTFSTGTDTFSAVITGQNYLDGTSTTINTNNKYIGAANNLMNPGESVAMDFGSTGSAIAAMKISFFNFDSSSKSAPDELTIYGTTIDGSAFSYRITNADIAADGTYTINAPEGALIKELMFEAGSQSSFKLGIETVTAVQYQGEDAQLDITYQLTDGDGDSATGTLSLTLSSSDAIIGTSGSDTLTGTEFNDVISGGAGNDTLTGGLGADVFHWTLADAGAAGTPAVDTITDFGTGGSADALDLRDLLPNGLTTGATLDNYMHFEVAGGNTIVHISSTGGFGDNNAVNAPVSGATETQQIVLVGVDLSAGGLSTDQQIIQSLIDNQKLLTD